MSADFSQLSPSELLTLYVDGELPEAMHQPLFSMLSEQSELQQELNDHLTMRRHFDTTLIPPPAGLHDSVMRRIGAFAVGASLNTPASVSIMQQVATVMGNAVQPLLYIVLGATLSGLLFMNQQKEQVPLQNAIVETSSSNLNSSLRDDMQFGASEISRKVAKHSYPALQASIVPFSPVQNVAFLQDTKLQESMPETFETGTILPQTELNQHDFSSLENAQLTLPIKNEEKGPISLLLRGFTLHSFTPQTVAPTISPMMNNASFSVNYALSENDAVFIEAGQEFLSQRFTSKEHNYTIQYDQTFLAGWATLGWQHTFAEQSSLRPMIRIGIGATETGPMGRMNIGIEYDLTKHLTFMTGIEGVAAIYSHQNQLFNTQKVGLTYGAKINL